MGLGDAIHDFFSSGKGLVRLAADRAFATGVWSALPTPSADFRGGWFRTEGGAGVEDAHYLALKNAADAPVFDEIATLAATQTFTNKTLTSPTLTTPTIADFTNAQHDHGDADDGGNIPATSVTGLEAVWLETLSPSAAATSSSGSVFSATYENYLIVFRLAMSADASLLMRLRVGGADESGANTYYTSLSRSGTALALLQSGATGLTSMALAAAIGGGLIFTDMIGVLWVASPFASNETVVEHVVSARYSTPGSIKDFGASHRNATTSYDAVTIFPSSGNITGTIRTYGIRNS
jgi:hypothetical protein